MAIDAGTALREGFDDLASARGVVFYVAFTVFSVATLPLHQTLTSEMNRLIVEVGQIPPDQLAAPATPLALDVSLPVLAAGLGVVFVVAEALRLVAVRAFASESSETIPMQVVTRRLLPTYGVLLAASLLVQVAVYGGLAVFVIPGLIAAMLTLFVRQAILLDDEGVLDSFRTSISIVVDNVLHLVLVLIALIVGSFVIGIPTILLEPESVARPIAGAILGTVLTVYGIAVFTRAYQQAVESEDDDRPPGPDDLDDGEPVEREPTV